MPGEPILRTPGGSGLDRICAAVSVRPMVSTMGTSKRVSNAVCTSGASGEEAERPKRSRALTEAGGSRSECSRCEMIVGTTENHVAFVCSAQSQKRLAENREQSASDPPDTSEPITDTHSPLIW